MAADVSFVCAYDGPWLGSVRPFTLKDSSQLSASPPPPHLGSGKYAQDYNEVKALGSLNSTERTVAQTALANFYASNLIDMWQRTLRGIVASGTDTGAHARLFALANMAAADAIITSWHDKRFWNFWRPLTAIQEGTTTATRKPWAIRRGYRSSRRRPILTTRRERTILPAP